MERIRNSPSWDLLKLVLGVAILAWLVVRGAEGLGYNWQWYRIPRYLLVVDEGRLTSGPLLKGLAVTLEITAAALGLAFALGLTTALLRLSKSLVGKLIARVYLETIRNTPLLIQLFFIYFVVAPIVGMSAFASAVLALSLFEGAYASEIFRAGIVSIDRGQWEAASSLGLKTRETYLHVILPQAIPRMLPPLTSQAISLIKDSALVSTIAIYDLTMRGRAVVAETYLTFEIWFTVAAVYLMMTLTLSVVVHRLEGRLRVES